MNTTNPYFRSFLVSALFFVALTLKMVSRHGGGWASYPLVNLVGPAFGVVITGFLVGLAASKFSQWQSWWAIGLGTLIGWFGVMSVMILLLKTTGPANKEEPSFATTDEMMKHFASEAAKWVKEDKGVDLDFSFESIKLIEAQLDGLSKKVNRSNPQPGMRGQAMSYGAYVGEVFRRKMGGSWAEDHPTGGEKSYPLTTRSNTVIFPLMWGWKRVINGEEDNIYLKAVLFTQADVVSTNTIEVKPAIDFK